jgi:hypothetical protein
MKFLVETSRRSTGLQLPHTFLRQGSPPPLAQLIRGGRGGEIRLKLYLTACLIAAAPPFQYSRPSPAARWAEALSVPAPGAQGARRVSDAFTWLDTHKFLAVDRARGRPPKFTLLSQSLDDKEYVKPTGHYTTVPLTLWTSHWIAALSGIELAVYLAIKDGPGQDAVGTANPRYLTGDQRDEYGFAPDTWTRATKQLVQLGLISVDTRVEGGNMQFRRNRKIYRVLDDALLTEPKWEPPASASP